MCGTVIGIDDRSVSELAHAGSCRGYMVHVFEHARSRAETV